MGGRGTGGDGAETGGSDADTESLEAGAKTGASLAPNSPDVCVPVHVHGVFDVFRSLAVSCTVRNKTVPFVEHLRFIFHSTLH